MKFFGMLASGPGRVVRIAGGFVMMFVGALILGGKEGNIAAIIGAVPFLAGIFDVCLFAPLAGLPIGGGQIRTRLASRS
ncbi:MAG: DUF2892 domain-containing protein [Bacteroidetes bacterium]|nr:DUF2892 domain-containing protein [Bacteroidota bacterium]